MKRGCKTNQELLETVREALLRLAELAKAEIQALHDHDTARLLSLDQKLELAFGEKERAIGALRQHREDHGC